MGLRGSTLAGQTELSSATFVDTWAPLRYQRIETLILYHLEMESLPVKKTKNRSVNRWQIETPRPRDPLPNPIGFSNQRVASSEIQSGGSVCLTQV